MWVLGTKPDPLQEQQEPLTVEPFFSTLRAKILTCAHIYPAWAGGLESFPKEVQLQTRVGGVKQ